MFLDVVVLAIDWVISLSIYSFKHECICHIKFYNYLGSQSDFLEFRNLLQTGRTTLQNPAVYGTVRLAETLFY